jgi:hypothetical protein
LIETSSKREKSGKVDVSIDEDGTICFSVYNNNNLYRLLTKAIEKYFS